MNLKTLLYNIKANKIIGNIDINIRKLSQNSKKIVKNTLFFCITGTKTDGMLYIKEAVNNGAIAIVLDKKHYQIFVENQKIDRLNFVDNIKNTTYIFVDDVRKAMAIMSSNFYCNPQKKLKIIGITGTNGKTSCSYIIAKLLKLFNKKVGVIGTNGVFINKKRYNVTMTTPDSIELFEIFAKMVKANVEYCVMEVSAHAIFFDKVYGIDFAVKALTNVQIDHLDFFKTLAQYQKIKQSFFDDDCFAVLNIDDKIGKKIAKKHKNFTNFGQKYAIFSYFDVNCQLGKTTFCLKYNNKIYKVNSKLTGSFNVQNLVLSIAVLHKFGFELDDIVSKVKYIKNLAGRFDIVYNSKRFSIIIDYAHTFDSLKNLLLTIKRVSQNKNIIVFGCPGERDTEKRFLMGSLVANFCEYAILTTDNPASENPKRIMFEIYEGINSQNSNIKTYLVENRESAIKKAIRIANREKNINVLIVGKGVEIYQIVGDKHIPYCDYDVVKKILK